MAKETDGNNLHYRDRTAEHNSAIVKEPIRESLLLFFARIGLVLIITNVAYMALNYFLLQAFFLEQVWASNIHDNIAYILTVLHIVTTAIQLWFISGLVFRWLGTSCTITQKHLVQRRGTVNSTDTVFDLNNVRSVSVHQSWMGKLCNYGNVIVEVSASGGYSDTAVLYGVSHPQLYEKLLRRHF